VILSTISICISIKIKSNALEPQIYKSLESEEYTELINERSIPLRKQDGDCHPHQSQQFDPETAKTELASLKKDVFSDEHYSTEQLRNQNKVYDPKWLITQLKIAKIVMIEDKLNERNRLI
jgi:hypothetical protein